MREKVKPKSSEQRPVSHKRERMQQRHPKLDAAKAQYPSLSAVRFPAFANRAKDGASNCGCVGGLKTGPPAG